jgi:hypothetical protein
LLASGNINTDCSPTGRVTGETLFTLRALGWGTGWVAGNCVRVRLHAGAHPPWLVRATQPSEPTGLSDGFELLFIGNIEAESA